jgi:adenylyltransferase/sulfurtransferase
MISLEDRYSRQIIIKEIGHDGQKKLSQSSVFVAGAGGLGSPILTYLTAAGAGRIGFIDSDTVAESNLNRQFLHNVNNIGGLKTNSAKEKLSALNDKIEIIAYNERLNEKNAAAFFSGYDIILGAVDSFETRFIINKACVSLSLPYIDGGINGFSGCVMFSNPPYTPCLNCVFPQPARRNEKKITGVLGITAGIIGTIEANTALLHLLGLPNPLKNKLLIYDGLNMSFDHVEILKNDDCKVCGNKK